MQCLKKNFWINFSLNIKNLNYRVYLCMITYRIFWNDITFNKGKYHIFKNMQSNYQGKLFVNICAFKVCINICTLFTDNIMKCMTAILNNKQHLHVFTLKCSSKYVMTEITKIFLISFWSTCYQLHKDYQNL